MSSVTAVITAKWNGGPRPGPPTFGVLHDAETPLEAGYARAIANMFATTTTQKSATYMVDPVDTFQLLDESLIAWHVGNANPRSIGVEQAGYAAFSLAQWSTPAAFQQEARVAQLMREIQGRHGIGLYWMSDQQLRDAHAGRIVGGWATHDQCTRVIGGSTHTDPAPNYPLARLMAAANNNSEEFTVAQYDDIMAAIKQVRDESWQQHKDMANYNGTLAASILKLLTGPHTDGKDRLGDIWANDNAHADEIEAKLDELKALLTPPAKS